MALSFAAIAAHPPIAIPQVGQDDTQLVETTVNALQDLKMAVDESQLNVLIILSTHDPRVKNAISIHQAEKLQPDFSNFGDLSTYQEYSNNIHLVHKLNHPPMDISKLVLDDRSKLDYGSSVIAYHLLGDSNTQTELIVINIGQVSSDELISYGEFMKEVIMDSELKIGVVASGDLAHTLNQDSPAGYWEGASKFDNQILSFIKHKEMDKLTHIDSNDLQQAVCCLWQPLLMLYGLMQNVNYQPHILAYEQPVGVGYLTAELKVN